MSAREPVSVRLDATQRQRLAGLARKAGRGLFVASPHSLLQAVVAAGMDVVERALDADRDPCHCPIGHQHEERHP